MKLNHWTKGRESAERALKVPLNCVTRLADQSNKALREGVRMGEGTRDSWRHDRSLIKSLNEGKAYTSIEKNHRRVSSQYQ